MQGTIVRRHPTFASSQSAHTIREHERSVTELCEEIRSPALSANNRLESCPTPLLQGCAIAEADHDQASNRGGA